MATAGGSIIVDGHTARSPPSFLTRKHTNEQVLRFSNGGVKHDRVRGIPCAEERPRPPHPAWTRVQTKWEDSYYGKAIRQLAAREEEVAFNVAAAAGGDDDF